MQSFFQLSQFPNLEAALSTLLEGVIHSDLDFDAYQLHLTEFETIMLAVQLIEYHSQHLNGRTLAGLLLALRESDSATD